MNELMNDPMAEESSAPLLRCYPQLQKGDAVFATCTIRNDGSIPGLADEQLLAQPGSMGMLVNGGHLEEDPSQEVLLVGFYLPDGQLALVTCLPQEISEQPAVAG
ncbi:MAG: nitrogen fixation protein NifZ [Pseudomonadota bacterium]|nr:nitrogen fixation protein NifZ [Pseudomonadota bacterium]